MRADYNRIRFNRQILYQIRKNCQYKFERFKILLLQFKRSDHLTVFKEHESKLLLM